MKLTFLLRIAILAAAQMTKIEIYTFHSETYWRRTFTADARKTQSDER